MTKTAIILLADGFEETEALAPADIMKRSGFAVTLLSTTQSLTVVSSHGVKVVADGMLSEFGGDYDLLMLPGGMPGTLNLLDNKAVTDEVLKAHAAGKWLAAICAAPMILGKLGLLKGLKATCYDGFEQHLEGAQFQVVPAVTDAKIITGCGAGASFHFGLAIIEALAGRQAAENTAKNMKITL